MDAGLIDLKSGDYAQLLRSPDLRLVGLSWDRLDYDRPFLHEVSDNSRAYVYYVQQGAAYFRTGPGDDQIHYIAKGWCAGVEGHPHQWMDASHVHRSRVKQPDGSGEQDLPLRMIVSSIDRSAAVLQRLPHGAIIIPADAAPHSSMIQGCFQLIELEQRQGSGDLSILRRLGEVIMLQLIAFARSRLWHGPLPAEKVRYDEFLLRAMTAFFAAPQQNWTVADLAKAAGLSRAAFSERFSRAFGEPPLKTLNRLRLQQAADMLVRSNASLGDIAIEVGFGSAAAFLRAFKRQFGMTPGGWRMRSRVS